MIHLQLACGKSSVAQHLKTTIHSENVKIKDVKKIQQKLEDVGKNPREEYLHDLTRLLLASNIPVSKVNHPVLQQFMQKYAKQRPVDRTTLTKRLVPSCFKEVGKIF
jgi:hypothetical protein